MTRERPGHDFACFTNAAARSSIDQTPVFQLPAWVYTGALVAMMLMLLVGCGDDDNGEHVHEDDFIVSFPSPLEIFIRRPFNEPFDLIEVGVTPFIDPVLGPEPYVLVVSGVAFFDGSEIVFEAEDRVRRAFIDPLGESVIDILIACDCFVDYVILRSELGDSTIFFD